MTCHVSGNVWIKTGQVNNKVVALLRCFVDGVNMEFSTRTLSACQKTVQNQTDEYAKLKMMLARCVGIGAYAPTADFQTREFEPKERLLACAIIILGVPAKDLNVTGELLNSRAL